MKRCFSAVASLSLAPSIARCALALFVLTATSGCVDRLLKIRSDPPGATVYVNGEKVGKTPLDHSVDFHGHYGIVLRLFDYRSVKMVYEIETPWFQYFPIDFFAENVVPWTIDDHYMVEIPLEKLEPDPENELSDLADQAEKARRESLRIEEDIEAPLRQRTAGNNE